MKATAKDLTRHVNETEIVISDPVNWNWPHGGGHVGAGVTDVGTNRMAGNRLIGDTDYDRTRDQAAWITTVPGGVGPMTVAILMHNTRHAHLGRQPT